MKDCLLRAGEIVVGALVLIVLGCAWIDHGTQQWDDGEWPL